MKRSSVSHAILSLLTCVALPLLVSTATEGATAQKPPLLSPATPNTTTQGIADSLKPVEAGLIVLAKGTVKQVLPNVARLDFGEASLFERTHVEQTFVIRNGLKTALQIERIQTSCGCTTAFLERDKETPGTSGTNLSPGQEVVLHVDLDLGSLPAGELHKYVLIFVAGQEKPVVLLEMTGTVLPLVSFSPAFVDFGRVAANKSVAQTLTVTLDKRLMEHGQRLALVTSNPDVILRLIPRTTKDTPPVKTKQEALNEKAIVQTYEITLSNHAAMGPVSGTLSFVPLAQSNLSDKGVPPKEIAIAKPQKPISMPTVKTVAQVIGLVQGDLTSQPQAMAFGTVVVGQETMRQVLLMGTKSAFQDLTVTSASRWVSAHLKAPEGGAKETGRSTEPKAQILEIIVSPKAPLGLLQTQIKIGLANGQRMLLPVSVVVGSPPVTSDPVSSTPTKP